MSSEPFTFDPAIVAAVLHHMNDDHAADNLLIARAFGDRSAAHARMVHVDGTAGHWVFATDDDATADSAGGADSAAAADSDAAAERPLRVAWSRPISERAEIRREIVALYDRACAELGITPRPHE